jgi:hypothetical protein
MTARERWEAVEVDYGGTPAVALVAPEPGPQLPPRLRDGIRRRRGLALTGQCRCGGQLPPMPDAIRDHGDPITWRPRADHMAGCAATDPEVNRWLAQLAPPDGWQFTQGDPR